METSPVTHIELGKTFKIIHPNLGADPRREELSPAGTIESVGKSEWHTGSTS